MCARARVRTAAPVCPPRAGFGANLWSSVSSGALVILQVVAAAVVGRHQVGICVAPQWRVCVRCSLSAEQLGQAIEFEDHCPADKKRGELR